MNQKSFLFIGSWMQPLEALPLQQRWNVMKAITDYSTTGTVPDSLDAMETIAFSFIRNEIDRMRNRRNEVCEKRRAAANSRWERKNAPGCKSIQEDAPYDIESVSESNSISEPIPDTKTTSSTSTGVRVRRNAGKKSAPYDDSQLLIRFFDESNRARLEAMAMKHRVGIAELRRLAEEITMQWALTDKTHDSYHDASLHLVFALAERISRDRQSRLKVIADGAPTTSADKGMLGIDEYIDAQGRRTYNGIDFIPLDAPPRPGKAFWWNHTTNSWDDIQ